MYFKYLVTITAALGAVSCATTESGTNNRSAKPNVSVSCFEDSPCKDQIGIVNNIKRTATNLNVFCPAKKNPSVTYKLASSFDLDPKKSKCIDVNQIQANCAVSSGFFTGHNVELKITSDDYTKWKKTTSCSWD